MTSKPTQSNLFSKHSKMDKSRNKGNKDKFQYYLSQNQKINVTYWRGQTYIHINNYYAQKSITLNQTEWKTLLSLSPLINEVLDKNSKETSSIEYNDNNKRLADDNVKEPSPQKMKRCADIEKSSVQENDYDDDDFIDEDEDEDDEDEEQ